MQLGPVSLRLKATIILIVVTNQEVVLDGLQ